MLKPIFSLCSVTEAMKTISGWRQSCIRKTTWETWPRLIVKQRTLWFLTLIWFPIKICFNICRSITDCIIYNIKNCINCFLLNHGFPGVKYLCPIIKPWKPLGFKKSSKKQLLSKKFLYCPILGFPQQIRKQNVQKMCVCYSYLWNWCKSVSS